MALRQMAIRAIRLFPVGLALLLLGAVLFNVSAVSGSRSGGDDRVALRAERLFEKGRRIFRFDTFGDQAFWGGALRLHKAIEGKKLGGVGPGVSPKVALGAGLKVDSAALPASVVRALKRGKVNLDSPKTTLALLKLNAVVGVKGFFNRRGTLRSVGLTCAVCHSTVDNSFAAGIGRRRDGWANRDLNVGAIVGLSRALDPALKAEFSTWGP